MNSQNKTLMIAATTYIDEFSMPVLAMNKKSEEANTRYQDFIGSQVVVIGSAMTTILILTLVAVYLLSKHAAHRYIYPIVHLADVVEGFGEGDLDIEATSINHRKDEIGTLARSFNRMRLQIKGQFQKLENNYATLKSTQEALKKSEQLYRSLFSNLPIGIYRSTPEGLVLDVNPTLVKMFGYPDKVTLLSRPAGDLYVDPEDREKFKQMFSRLHLAVISSVECVAMAGQLSGLRINQPLFGTSTDEFNISKATSRTSRNANYPTRHSKTVRRDLELHLKTHRSE